MSIAARVSGIDGAHVSADSKLALWGFSVDVELAAQLASRPRTVLPSCV